MRKGLTFLLPAALSVMMAVPSLAQDNIDPATVVARVNGQEITLGHMIVTFSALPQQYQQLPVDVLYPNILDQLIQQTALAQSIEKEDPLYVRLSVENERRALLAAEEIDRVLTIDVNEAEIQAAYDAEYAEGYGGDEYNAAHILLDTEDDAISVKAMLDTGANFAGLAQEKSTGPSGPNGGSLGWFGLGAMVPEFEAAVVALKPGQASDPVETQFGWHVIILNEKRKATAPPLDQVHEEITNRLRNETIEQRVAEVTAAAKVERPVIEGLDMSIMQQLDLVRN
ncbi:MAG: peptidyl-prolyl cis-trans isomerase C [Paracoccaceae bacterium]|jgi:peptidyl-prolyl cis-trans isomerase C